MTALAVTPPSHRLFPLAAGLILACCVCPSHAEPPARFTITPADVPNTGILFVDHQREGRIRITRLSAQSSEYSFYLK